MKLDLSDPEIGMQEGGLSKSSLFGFLKRALRGHTTKLSNQWTLVCHTMSLREEMIETSYLRP